MTTAKSKPKGIIRIETPEQHRRRMLISLLGQGILQTGTFLTAVWFYHTVALPGLLKDSFQNGQAAGWSNAVEQTCPEVKDRIGG
jgi:hypothetical protein